MTDEYWDDKNKQLVKFYLEYKENKIHIQNYIIALDIDYNDRISIWQIWCKDNWIASRKTLEKAVEFVHEKLGYNKKRMKGMI